MNKTILFLLIFLVVVVGAIVALFASGVFKINSGFFENSKIKTDLEQERIYTAKSENSRIVGATVQARTAMLYSFANNNNYDSLSCLEPEMVPLCQRVREYGPFDLKMSHAPSIDSSSACVWTKLYVVDLDKGDPFYCVDYTGAAGYTFIDPASDEYCGNSQEVTCPPLSASYYYEKSYE